MSSDEREESPDWIRVFKERKACTWTLSSDSESCPPPEEDRTAAALLINSDDEVQQRNTKKSAGEEVETTTGGRRVLSTTLPLLLPEKVQYTKALVECEGDSIDLSGDVGAVGRIITSPSLLFDLKGIVYRTSIVPSRSFCVVNFGQTEARIESVMNDFIQLKPLQYEAETMVEGTLQGFSFDSEDDADQRPAPDVDDVDRHENAPKPMDGRRRKPGKHSSKMQKRKKGPTQKRPRLKK